MKRTQTLMGARFVAFHEARVAGDIGDDHRDEPAADRHQCIPLNRLP